MRKDLERELLEEFDFFGYKEWKGRGAEAIKYTLMPFGFECGDGWHVLIRALCKSIQNEIDNLRMHKEYAHLKEGDPKLRPIDKYRVVQVKEKFGTLRWYDTNDNDHISGMRTMAEYLSGHICEACGNPGTLRENRSWIVTLCDNCDKKDRTQKYWRTFWLRWKWRVKSLKKPFLKRKTTRMF